MNRKITRFLFFIILVLVSCSKEKTDEFLVKKDKEQLEKSLYSEKVLTYKLGKICLRASIAQDTISPEFQKVKSSIDEINKITINNNVEALSVIDYLNIYRSYRKIKKFIRDTDEDIFPTLMEAFSVYASSKKGEKIKGNQLVLLKGEEKAEFQNMEHAVLSALVVMTRDLGKEVSLYECYKTDPDKLEEGELKALLQFYRGFIFFEKRLLYLSEEEITTNIDWLVKNPDVDLSMTRAVFDWNPQMDKRKTYLAFLSLNHLFRGMDRLMMDRKIDEQRALEDFEVFITHTREIGLNNELSWSVEAYVYIKKEDKEKAIAALTNLKSSRVLSDTDKKTIEEAIDYIQSREKGNWSNTIFDKLFLGKIVSKYIFFILKNLDWKKLLEDNNVPYTQEIFDILEKMRVLSEKLEKYTDKETIKETSGEVIEKGTGLFQKVKEMIK